MASNYKKGRMTYEVDLVFCIDATLSMDNILDKVKANALNFYQDFQEEMTKKGKKVGQLRIRLVVFRDYYYDMNPMMQTNFFTLPEQSSDFEACLKSIIPDGGGDDPEDGLEALAMAIKYSKWSNGASKKRHVIVVWSDEGTHELGFGAKSNNYPEGMPKNFNELTEWWGSKSHPGYMDETSKRLILFTPDKPGWNTISRNWNNVIHSVTDDDDAGLSKVDYLEILGTICNSI